MQLCWGVWQTTTIIKNSIEKNPKASEQEVIDYAILRKTLRELSSQVIFKNKDYFQTADPWYRVFNMFLSFFKQYMSKEIIAARQLFRMMQARIIKEHLSKIHELLPCITLSCQWFFNMCQWDCRVYFVASEMMMMRIYKGQQP